MDTTRTRLLDEWNDLKDSSFPSQNFTSNRAALSSSLKISTTDSHAQQARVFWPDEAHSLEMQKNSLSSSTRSSGELKVFHPQSDEKWDQTSSNVKSNSVAMTLKKLPRILSRSLLVRVQRDDDFFRAEDIEDV